MARLNIAVTTEGEIALSAATAKTVLQVKAATNQRVAITGLSVTFDGVAVTNEPVNVVLLRQTSSGTMTASTPRRKDGGLTTTIQTTALKNATAEPTAGDVLKRFHVHPQAGYERVWGRDEEIIIGANGRVGVQITAPQAVNCLASIDCEE